MEPHVVLCIVLALAALNGLATVATLAVLLVRACCRTPASQPGPGGPYTEA